MQLVALQQKGRIWLRTNKACHCFSVKEESWSSSFHAIPQVLRAWSYQGHALRKPSHRCKQEDVWNKTFISYCIYIYTYATPTSLPFYWGVVLTRGQVQIQIMKIDSWRKLDISSPGQAYVSNVTIKDTVSLPQNAIFDICAFVTDMSSRADETFFLSALWQLITVELALSSSKASPLHLLCLWMMLHMY